MDFLDELNAKTGGRYSFLRVKQCTIKRGDASVEFEFLVPDYCYISFAEDDKTIILAAVRDIVPKNLDVKVKYIKSIIDVDVVRKFLYEYIDKNCPTVGIKNFDFYINVDKDPIHIVAKVKTIFFNYLKANDFLGKVAQYFSHCIYKNVAIKLEEVKGDVDFGVTINTDNSSELYIMRKIRTSGNDHIKGKAIVGMPDYIVDKKGECADAIHCGKIIDLQRKIAKSGNPFYIMSISDTTGVMIVKAFTKSPKVTEFDQLKLGDEIIVQGKIVADTYAKDNVMMINNIAKCKIDYDSIITKKPFKKEPSNYSVVFPQAYVDSVQLGFLDGKTSEPPTTLIGEDFVVFDLETTGLATDSCKITEIGAVKVRDGVIIETFTSLCDPQELLSDEIINITHITDDMLKGKPTFFEVFPDFYKFTRGASLVAHNAKFDCAFIDRYAANLNYCMDNARLDTIMLAKQRVLSPSYKLSVVCKLLEVELIDAHRAINDAVATAKVFIELARRKPFDI